MSAPEQPDAEQRAEAVRLARQVLDRDQEYAETTYSLARALLAAEADFRAERDLATTLLKELRAAEAESDQLRDAAAQEYHAAEAMTTLAERAEAELAELRPAPFEYRKVFETYEEMVAWLGRLARVERLEETLRRISEWDCLNPPDPNLCADHPWLARLVSAALSEPTEGET